MSKAPSWLFAKVKEDYSKIPLKKFDPPKVIFIPEKPTKTYITDKPDVDFRQVWSPPINRDVFTEVSVLLHKVTRSRDKATPQRGHYFTRTISGKLQARCIMGALILELAGGEQMAERIVSQNLNAASWGIIVARGVVPARFRNQTLLNVLYDVQNLNDQGSDWETISRFYDDRTSHYMRVA